MRFAPPVAALAAAALLTACGGGDPASPTATTAPPVTTTTPAATTSATGSPTPSGGPGCPLLQAPEPGTTVVAIRIAGGKVDTPERRVTVKTGSQVRLEVTSDVADQVHVHTYDEYLDTIAGCTVALTFQAKIPGTHEVELEGSHRLLVEIRAS